MNAGDLCVIGLLLTPALAFGAAAIAEAVCIRKFCTPKRDDTEG